MVLDADVGESLVVPSSGLPQSQGPSYPISVCLSMYLSIYLSIIYLFFLKLSLCYIILVAVTYSVFTPMIVEILLFFQI